MQFFRNLPLRRKLNVITMATSSAALILACLGFITYEQITFRQTMRRDFAILAQMMADEVAPAVDFEDKDYVDHALRTLSAHPHIISAAVYDTDGKVVASYQRSDLASPVQFPEVSPTGSHFGNNRLNTFHHAVKDGDDVCVYIAADLAEMGARLWRYALIMSIVLVASSLVAFWLSASLRNLISEPISRLAKVVSTVSSERNYSLRVVKENEDELGKLIDGFNEMLNQIQERDFALQRSQVDLEHRVEERTQELANSLSLIRATLESTTDGILVTDSSGVISDLNERFTEMWGFSQETSAYKDSLAMVECANLQLKDPAQFLVRIRDIETRPDSESFDALEFSDGRVFERYSKPRRIGDQNVGRVWSFRDVTERKRAEAELEDMHRQLVETSRQAGMAEVATSVLHNVGNVLNSVNVSCSVISDKVRKSKVGSVSKMAEVLREKSGDLGGFFSQDPVGQKLPEFLGKLAGRLAEEQTSILGELRLLGQNIEHIKDIVAVQQSYAKNVGGVRDTAPLEGLVEDALRMNAGGLARHNIEVQRNFEDVPPTSMEKHKVLQILVNLIRNAKHALTDLDAPNKKLNVRINRDSSHLLVSIQDNGIGIAPENLTRIFAHGFTTKKDGHGFGLHSGVLAAQQMGGSLTAESDGPGLGAIFTLSIPLTQNGSTQHESNLAESFAHHHGNS